MKYNQVKDTKKSTDKQNSLQKSRIFRLDGAKNEKQQYEM